MPKPPRLSLASIVAESAAAPHVQSEATPIRSASAQQKHATTLKERAKQLSVYLEPAVYEQLRDIAYTERTKIHSLILEGLDLVFRERGARSIGELDGALASAAIREARQ